MKNGLVKIGDLNVSKLAKIGKANTHTGTPYYSSPEIWIDQPYNNKTDIWSVGCIIYEMCTLSPPFRGTSLINLYNNIQKGVYSPIPENYSKELSYVISLMLVVDPNVRASCDKLLGLNIIQDKMKEIKRFNCGSENDYKVELIQTIKLPKKLKDINRVLPHKKKYHVENEMMENDEFETKKAGFFKKVNKENNNNNNIHHGGKHISNSHNKQINHNNISNHPANKRPASAIQKHNPSNKINNIHPNNSNQKNYNSNNNNRPSSGKKISNNLMNNKPTNNVVNSNNNNNINHNKIKIKPKINDNNNMNNMRVRKRPISARPSQKQGLNINKSNNNQIKDNNNKHKVNSSKNLPSNNNNNLNSNNNHVIHYNVKNKQKIVIEKLNYNKGKKKPLVKPPVSGGYKPKIGNRK
jgi:NIMA (never in mitosis gene a)-related kinase